MTVYVLHFDPRYKQAGHYIGYTPAVDPARRIKQHTSGHYQGSPLVKAAIAAGCQVKVAAIFPGAGRDFERWLKDSKNTNRWCPHCGEFLRPYPTPERMSEKFKAAKPNYSCQ